MQSGGGKSVVFRHVYRRLPSKRRQSESAHGTASTHPLASCPHTDIVLGRVQGREFEGGLEIGLKNGRRTGQRLEDGQNPDEGNVRGRKKGRNGGGIGRGMTQTKDEGHSPQKDL